MASCSRQSMDLAEVYRVIYEGPEDNLRGAILTTDAETGFQIIFKDKDLVDCGTRDIGLNYLRYDNYMEANKKLDPSTFPPIEDGDHIMLNGPIEASIGVAFGFTVSFYLFGAIHCTIVIPSHRGNSKFVSVPLRRIVESDDGNKILTMLYAIFVNAVEAHVKVKLIKVKSDFDLYGVIAARTSAIMDPAYSSILFFKEPCEKKQVKRGDDDDDDDEIEIPLSRTIVGVPLGAELIILFSLSSDDNDKMVRESVSIDVKNIVQGSVYSHPPISCDKCVIKLEIEWRCQRVLEEVDKYEWSDEETN